MESPIFCFVLVSCSVTGYDKAKPGFLLFTPTSQVFTHIDQIPLSLLISSLSNLSSLSLSSYVRSFSPLFTLVAHHHTCFNSFLKLKDWARIGSSTSYISLISDYLNTLFEQLGTVPKIYIITGH